MLSFSSFYEVSDNICMKALFMGIIAMVSPITHRYFEKYQKLFRSIPFEDSFLVKLQLQRLQSLNVYKPRKNNGRQ